jgi:hypothetical protein
MNLQSLCKQKYGHIYRIVNYDIHIHNFMAVDCLNLSHNIRNLINQHLEDTA